MDRIRLGLIQTNHDRSKEIGDLFPDDSHRFRDLFDQLDQRFTYRVYMTEGGELPESPDEQDAYLITGSPLSVLDEIEWLPRLFAFIRACDAAKIPIVGTCFGHQAIAMALGGKVERVGGGYNVGVEETVFSTHKPWMDADRTTLPMYVFHEDQVTRLPDGCELLGGSNKCAIASFSKGNHIFTTQSHPEIDERFMRAILEYTAAKMPETDFEEAFTSLSRNTDGVTFAQWATDLILAARHDR